MEEQAMPSSLQALPSARDFAKLSRQHSLVPVYRVVTADLETPVSAFLRIAADEPEAFLLESVEGGEHALQEDRVTWNLDPHRREGQAA
jgi:anthranilate synthase component 1